jgi:SH3-like domain-containing protein
MKKAEGATGTVDSEGEEPQEVAAPQSVETPLAELELHASEPYALSHDNFYASVIKDGVFVRSGPTTEYRVLRTVHSSYPFLVIGTRGNWTNVRDFMGQEGWVFTPLLGVINSAIVKVAKANLRSGPGLENMVAGQVEYGTVMPINDTRDSWYMIITPAGVEGWISRELVWPEEPGTPPQDAFKQETIETPGPSSDTPVKVDQYQDNDVDADSVALYAPAMDVMVIDSGASIELAVQDAEETAKDVPLESEIKAVQVSVPVYAAVRKNGRGANMRPEPSLDTEVLRTVPEGYPLLVLDKNDHWTFVQDFRDRKAWVYSPLLTEQGTVVVKVAKGNLRNGPSLADEIVAKLDYGTVMRINDSRGAWLLVSGPDEAKGWVHDEVVWP